MGLFSFWKDWFAPVSEIERDRLKKKSSLEPWADLQYVDGKLSVVDFNDAFVDSLRVKFGDLITEEMTDQAIVQLYVDRENIEREEPRLEVLHLGIEDDGQLKIKLDWNKAFINLLLKNGFSGETEDEIIKNYLARLTTETADLEGELDDVLTRDQINEAFREIDVEAQREFDEAAASIKKPKRSYIRKPRGRNT